MQLTISPPKLRGPLSFLLIAAAIPCAAQWLDYPTANVPRTPDGKPNLSASAPRTPDGRPDFSGIWDMERGLEPTQLAGQFTGAPEARNLADSLKDGLPFTPWAADLLKARAAENRVNDPLSFCLPLSLPRLHALTFKKIVQTPSLLMLAYEYNNTYRQIHIDGRALPVDPNPSWLGYSSGKWEGDTLVVLSAGFRDDLWLDNTGNPLTGDAKIIERFRRINFGQLNIELTIDDPKAYTKPWTVTLHQKLVLNTELLENMCLENEKSTRHFHK